MANTKYSKKYRRYKRFYKRYKSLVSYNYFKIKAEFNDFIYFPDQRNQPVFGSREADQVLANRSLLTNANAFQGYSFINMLAGIFSYYKIIGIRVEVTPDARNQSLQYDTDEELVYLSYRAGRDNIQNIAEARVNNQSLVMNPIQKQVKYFKVYNDNGRYTSTEYTISGAWTVVSTNAGVYDEQPSYKVRVVYYLLYKYSKA